MLRTLLQASTRNMSTVTEVVTKLEQFANISLGENWDNIGLLIEPATPQVINHILLTNDLTEKVMHEAIFKRSNLIISYHPPIFTGLKRITQKTWKERIVALCLENKIALYSPHTSWDCVRNGVNDWLIEAMPIKTSKPVIPHQSDDNVGAGRIADLSEILTVRDAIDKIKRYTQLNNLQVGLGVKSTLDSEVRSVAVCAGSGSTVLKNVKADLVISGEMSHHEVLDINHKNITVILLNHSNSERGYLNTFKGILTESLNNDQIKIEVSAEDTDPLKPY